MDEIKTKKEPGIKKGGSSRQSADQVLMHKKKKKKKASVWRALIKRPGEDIHTEVQKSSVEGKCRTSTKELPHQTSSEDHFFIGEGPRNPDGHRMRERRIAVGATREGLKVNAPGEKKNRGRRKRNRRSNEQRTLGKGVRVPIPAKLPGHQRKSSRLAGTVIGKGLPH